MNKEDLEIGEEYFYNTTGAFQKPISLHCEILDIGQVYVWLMIKGNVGPTPITDIENLTKEPKHITTNWGL